MIRLSYVLAAAYVLGVMALSPSWAQDPAAPPVQDAQGAAAPAEAADPTATERPELSIKDEINVDLIDLTELRQAAEQQLDTQIVRLTLKEAVQMALTNNEDILVTAYEPMKSEADLYIAQGEFDPMIQGSSLHTEANMTADQQIQAFSGITSMESKGTKSSISVGGKLHTGTQYAAQLNYDWSESTFGKFVTQYDSMLLLTLTQPLIRGFGTKVNNFRIEQARSARQMSEARLKATVLKTIGEVVKGYWDLAFAVDAVQVRIESLKNAERLLQINETRRKIGTAADIEVLQAKAGVAGRQSEVIAATARATDAGNLFKQLLGLREGAFLSKAKVVPTDRPNPDSGDLFDFTKYNESLDKSVQLALEKRPELMMSDMEIQIADLDVLNARDKMKPQIDLVGSYGQGARDTDKVDTLTGIVNRKDYTYSLGVQGSIAINNRAARGSHQRAELTKRQAEERRKQTELALMTAVHLAASNVKTNQILVESNRQAVRLQEVNVVADEKRLRLGVATSFEVLRTQEDLATAQNMELQARVAYEKSVVDLQSAQGTLLEDLGIRFAAPGAEIAPVPYGESIAPRWE